MPLLSDSEEAGATEPVGAFAVLENAGGTIGGIAGLSSFVFSNSALLNFDVGKEGSVGSTLPTCAL